jgi:hypothetical protein
LGRDKNDKNRRSLKIIAELIDQYEPSAIVFEDYAGKGSRRRHHCFSIAAERVGPWRTRDQMIEHFKLGNPKSKMKRP